MFEKLFSVSVAVIILTVTVSSICGYKPVEKAEEITVHSEKTSDELAFVYSANYGFGYQKFYNHENERYEAILMACYTYGNEELSIPSEVNIDLPVTIISEQAFENCRNIKSLYISKNVEIIQTGVFGGCYDLEKITVSTENKYYSHDENNVLFNKDKTVLVKYPKGKTTKTYRIPDGVIEIGKYSFCGCKYLESITISDAVTHIGEFAFDSCYGLKSITFNSNIAVVGEGAFAFSPVEKVYISSLSSWCAIEFDNTLHESNPLWYASQLYLNGKLVTELVIPDGVKSIGDYAFYGFSGIKSVTVPNTVTSIGESAFSNCVELQNVYISEGLKNIGDGAFSCCVKLKSITIPDGVFSIGTHTFSNCVKLKSITIPDGVLSIGSYAFTSCICISNITIPGSVTEIGEYAFAYCDGLSEIVVPDSVRYVGKEAFSSCYGLKSVKVLNKYTTFGEAVFAHNPGLVLYGYEGYTAQIYASENSIDFALLPAVYGDVNDSGFADGADVVLLSEFVSGKSELQNEQIALANVYTRDDKDGKPVVNIKDVIALAQYVASVRNAENSDNGYVRMGSKGVALSVVCDSADDNNGFYASMGLYNIKDPDDADNRVFKVSCEKPGKQYSYLWNNMEFKAGSTYLVEFDARISHQYDGTMLKKGYLGCCFHYDGKDHGFGGGEVYCDKWKRISFTYTIPEDYVYNSGNNIFMTGNDRFGIYGEPSEGFGVTFLVDNVTVVPVSL